MISARITDAGLLDPTFKRSPTEGIVAKAVTHPMAWNKGLGSVGNVIQEVLGTDCQFPWGASVSTVTGNLFGVAKALSVPEAVSNTVDAWGSVAKWREARTKLAESPENKEAQSSLRVAQLKAAEGAFKSVGSISEAATEGLPKIELYSLDKAVVDLGKKLSKTAKLASAFFALFAIWKGWKTDNPKANEYAQRFQDATNTETKYKIVKTVAAILFHAVSLAALVFTGVPLGTAVLCFGSAYLVATITSGIVEGRMNNIQAQAAFDQQKANWSV